MAIPIFEDDILELRYGFYCNNQAGFNVRHLYAQSIKAGGLSIEDILTTHLLAVAAELVPLIGENAEFCGLGLRKVHPTLSVEIHTLIEPQPGTTGNGETVPTQATGLLSLYTSIPGPRGRGRMYVPFPGEAHNDTDSLPTEAYLDDMETFATSVLDPETYSAEAGDVILPVIYNDDFHTALVVNRFVARRRWGTQRRRGSYGKANEKPFQ